MPASFSYAQPSEANSIGGGDVEQLKQRWQLLDYLQQQNWAVRPAGYDSEFVGLCPLHPDTRPSFYVNARKNLFYCHGCERGGDPQPWGQVLVRCTETSTFLLPACRSSLGVQPAFPSFLSAPLRIPPITWGVTWNS